MIPATFSDCLIITPKHNAVMQVNKQAKLKPRYAVVSLQPGSCNKLIPNSLCVTFGITMEKDDPLQCGQYVR